MTSTSKLAILALTVLANCVSWEPYHGREIPANQDPDALYAAAVRVFLRKGWGFQNRDPVARALETDWIRYEGDGRVHLSHRILIRQNRFEIFTNCWNGDPGNALNKKCDPDERPEGTGAVEDRLVAAIMAEAKDLQTTSEPHRPPNPAGHAMATADVKQCVSICGTDRKDCQRACGKSDTCREACVKGYLGCVGACGSK